MTTISGAGGTTTSLSNTPQAGDDCYSFTEDQLLGDSTLYSVANDTIYLNVMANDLGGKAKSLFSISDVDGTPIDDLTTTDLLSNSKNSCWEQTTEGNWIRIYNGKIEYRLDGRNVDSLGVGDTIADSFVYAIKLGNGTLSWATVHVNLAGSNDALVITPGGDYSGGVAETSGTPADGAPDLTDSGSFAYTDVDTSDIATVGTALKLVNGVIDSAALALGDFSASISGDTAATNGGTVTWTYAVDPDLLESMAQGETLVLVYTVTVDDGHGSTQARDVTITVTGTNDAPVITSETQSGTVVEDTTLSASGQVTAEDIDNGAVLSYTGDAAGTYGSFVVDPDTGEWTYTLANAAHQNLAEGESHDEMFDVTVTDQWGLTSYQTVTIRVVGTNDDPEAAAATDAGDEDTVISGSVTATDIDDGAVLSYALVGAAPAGLTFNPDGSYSLDAADAAYQHLAAGATTEVEVTYEVTDQHGASDTATLKITVTGVNDAPELTGDRQATVLEGGAYVLTGTDLGFTDPDDNAAGVTFTVSGLTNGVIKVNGATQTSFTGTQLAAGQVSFVHNDSETLSAMFQVSVEDGNEDSSAPLASAFNLTVTPVADIDTVNDSWVLSDTALPAGTITASWFTHNDTGALKYVVSVAGLTADGAIGLTGLSADFEVVGGVNQLVAITGTAVTGNHSIGYTLSDGSSTATATVSLRVLDTTGLNNNFSATPLDGNDFSYIDLQAGQDQIVGDAVLEGNAGIDIFVGGAGNDILTGGDGNDTLTGGLGNDTFRFLLVSDAVDTILDFTRISGPGSNLDKIEFDNDSFTALVGNGLFGQGTLMETAFRIGAAAADADDRIIYDNTTGKLYYDADGTGAALQIHIATLDDGLALTNGAFAVI